MSRRQDADIVVDLVRLLPWWVGVGVAVASYLILHAIASQPMPEALTGSKDAGNFALSALMIWMAKIGQYVIPGLALFGALLSAIKQKMGKQVAPKNRAPSRAKAVAPTRVARPAVTAVENRQHNNNELEATPACPSCGSMMVRRTYRKGSKAGMAFWGCTTYPRCKGVLPIEQIE